MAGKREKPEVFVVGDFGPFGSLSEERVWLIWLV